MSGGIFRGRSGGVRPASTGRVSPRGLAGFTLRHLLLATLAGLLLAVAAAPWIAPQDPADLASLSLGDAQLPPAWLPDGAARYPLGTDDQGRDLLSVVLYGARVSLMLAALAVGLSLLMGLAVGLLAGYRGGRTDRVLMRLCDAMLAFPAILIALLIDGIGRVLAPGADEAQSLAVLVFAIALAGWVPYARTVRAATQVERQKAYIDAARLMGVGERGILLRHLLPNVLGAVWVLAPLQLASAVLTEATLSFLGVGVPPTAPSLGSLIRVGGDHLLSGAWWIALVPGVLLLLLALAFNLVGEAWRRAADPLKP